MKRENVKKNIGIISAFADGKTIQILNEIGEWVDLTEREGLPIGILEEEPNNFRIKPEFKYRPFKDAEASTFWVGEDERYRKWVLHT